MKLHWRKNKKGNIGNQNNLEVRRKISKANKGKNVGKNNVMNRPEVKLKHKYILNLPSIRKKISIKGKGRKHSLEHRQKNSETKIGKNNPNYKKIYTEQEKYQRRIKALNNIKKLGGPKIGKNETKILDNFAKQIGYKIIRQYLVNGYALDGYIPELKLAIEVDERRHFDIKGNLKEKDINRQKRIEKKLNCNFMRIKDE